MWGMMHGILYVVTKWWIAKEKRNSDNIMLFGKLRVKKIIGCIFTFVYVSIAWVYFRAPSVEGANTLLMNIFNKPWGLPGSGFTDAFNLGEFWYMLKILKVATLPYAQYYIMILFSAVMVIITFSAKFKPTIFNAMITAVLLVWCVVSLAGVSTFLYFNF